MFAIAAAAGSVVHKGVADPLYVILLFAICSTPIFEAKAINGPYSLLVLWSADYFLMYGVLDFRNLILGVEGTVSLAPRDLISSSELLIVFGGLLVQAAYRLACRRGASSTSRSLAKGLAGNDLGCGRGRHVDGLDAALLGVERPCTHGKEHFGHLGPAG